MSAACPSLKKIWGEGYLMLNSPKVYMVQKQKGMLGKTNNQKPQGIHTQLTQGAETLCRHTSMWGDSTKDNWESETINTKCDEARRNRWGTQWEQNQG